MTPVYTLGKTLLRIKDVSLELGKEKNLILHDVNAEIKDVSRPDRPDIHQGQVVGFLGPSGIGKTQLLLTMAGLRKPTSGQVTVRINDIEQEVRPGMVGVVSQHYTLFEHRTVKGNLMKAARKSGLGRKEALEAIMEFLDHFNLSDRLRHYPAQLSGGQRQRVSIIQQLLVGHKILLMDEPFSGLDIVMLEKVAKLIEELAQGDELLTIIVVSHDVAAAASVSDTLWLMGLNQDPENPGQFLPGASIQEQYNLIDRGLAWQDDILLRPDFIDFVREVKDRFQTLAPMAA